MKFYLILGLFFLACFDRSTLLFAEDKIAWGEEVNGLRIGIVNPIATATSDQELKFNIIVQNVSQQPITLPTPDTFVRWKRSPEDKYHGTPLTPVIKEITERPTDISVGYNMVSMDMNIVPDLSRGQVITLSPGGSKLWESIPIETQTFFLNEQGLDMKFSLNKWYLIPNHVYRLCFCYENKENRVMGKNVWTGQAKTGAADIHVNPPSTEGFKVAGNFTLPKNTYFIGEPIYATCTVTNQGNRIIEFPTNGDRRPLVGDYDYYVISAVDELGRNVPNVPLQPRTTRRRALVNFANIKPGESYTEKLFINLWGEFSKAGKYKIKCKHFLYLHHPGDRDDHPYDKPESCLPTLSIDTTLEVKLVDDPPALAAYIDPLISSMSKGEATVEETDQLENLAQVCTPAAFVPIQKLLEDSSKAQYEAVRYLSYYGSEKAGPILLEKAPKLAPNPHESVMHTLLEWNVPGVDALMTAELHSSDHEVRERAVLISFNTSRSNNFFPILLTMADDPDPIVKINLIQTLKNQALGEPDDKRAIPVLNRLLHDPDPNVKIRTALALKQLKHMEGVPVLIDLLRDPKIGSYNMNKTMEVLGDITDKHFGDDCRKWFNWWEKEGRAEYEK